MAQRTAGRIVIPKNAAELLDLAKKIYEKHQNDGANSLLNAMQDYSWDDGGPKIAHCKDNHDKAEDFAKKAEQYYRQRDLDLVTIKGVVQNSAQVLKSIYAKNPKILAEYGFVVDDSKQTKK